MGKCRSASIDFSGTIPQSARQQNTMKSVNKTRVERPFGSRVGVVLKLSDHSRPASHRQVPVPLEKTAGASAAHVPQGVVITRSTQTSAHETKLPTHDAAKPFLPVSPQRTTLRQTAVLPLLCDIAFIYSTYFSHRRFPPLFLFTSV